MTDANATSSHNLSQLSVLTKDFALLKANYVDSADLDSQKIKEMFEAALERVNGLNTNILCMSRKKHASHDHWRSL